ncbi:MAG: hypothetical protein K0M66_10945 [Thiobacillus sp.]|nr:hypothetical protein [Thiobacillus sp.]
MKATFSGNYFSRRWHGQVPLAVLLWRDMLGVGTVVNLIVTILALTAIIRGAHAGLAVALHFAPMPYNLFLFAAIWRAPDRNTFTSIVAAGWLAVVTLI